jgi:small subunit ribosomal protein S6
MKNYETLCIVNPDLPEETYQEVVKKFTGLIEKEKGIVVKVEEWGRQKLAYDLKKFDTGTYVLLNYCGGPGITAELERELRLDDKVLKYLTVKLADKVDPEAMIAEQREIKKVEATAEEEAPDTEKTTPDEGVEPTQEVKDGVR